MNSSEIRTKFKKFFESKGHTWVESSSLLPTDPSVLFTTAGMQQFKPYYTDPTSAPALNVASIQKCMRTSDIDEVGDESHLTFFEMLGNFSFGGYWKKEAIAYAHEFITKEMGLTIDYVSVFGGEGDVPADEESEKIWQSVDSSLIVKRFGRADNFWGPTGSEGPCGPTTEIYVNGVEIWNVVFNQYFQHTDGHLELLKTQGIDTGMGLERLAMAVQKKSNIFETDLFLGNTVDRILLAGNDRSSRIIADHLRSSIFLLSDGLKPSNKEQGYILRRLIRRLLVQAKISSLDRLVPKFLENLLDKYADIYPELKLNREIITEEFKRESDKFTKNLDAALNEFYKKYPSLKVQVLERGKPYDVHTPSIIDIKDAFYFQQSFGLTLDILKDLARKGLHKVSIDEKTFEEERKRHQEISRAGAEKKFGGHGMKEGDLTAGDAQELQKKTRLHTATHVVVAALEKVLGEPLKQAGSDITTDRLRFDFAFPRKLTADEIERTQKIANQAIADNLEVWSEELSLEEAFASGAQGAFAHKYPPRVKVYTIGPKGSYFSREICGGPHVTRTSEIGHITITKEESVSGGNRRIRAVIY